MNARQPDRPGPPPIARTGDARKPPPRISQASFNPEQPKPPPVRVVQVQTVDRPDGRRNKRVGYNILLWAALLIPVSLAICVAFIAWRVASRPTVGGDVQGVVKSQTVVVGQVQQSVVVRQVSGGMIQVGNSTFRVGEVIDNQSMSWRGKIKGVDGDRLEIEVVESHSTGSSPTYRVGDVLKLSPDELVQQMRLQAAP